MVASRHGHSSFGFVLNRDRLRAATGILCGEPPRAFPLVLCLIVTDCGPPRAFLFGFYSVFVGHVKTDTCPICFLLTWGGEFFYHGVKREINDEQIS